VLAGIAAPMMIAAARAVSRRIAVPSMATGRGAVGSGDGTGGGVDPAGASERRLHEHCGDSAVVRRRAGVRRLAPRRSSEWQGLTGHSLER